MQIESQAESPPSRELPCECRIRLIIKVLSRLLELWERRISDLTLTKLLLGIMTHAQSQAVVADVFVLIARFMFCSSVDLIYYFIRAYMEHWNSYDNRRLGLDSLLDQQGRDFRLVYTWRKGDAEEMREITATRQQLLEMKKTMTVFQISEKLMLEKEGEKVTEEEQHLQIFVAIITKVRLVTCDIEELPDLIHCVLRALHIFCLI